MYAHRNFRQITEDMLDGNEKRKVKGHLEVSWGSKRGSTW